MSHITGVVATILVALSLILNSIPLFILAGVRGVMRALGSRRAVSALSRCMDYSAYAWIYGNRLIFKAFGLTRIDADWHGEQTLSRDRWFIMISNHQSWTDIFVLQLTFLDRVPTLKFFTKRQLLWIPFFGQAMWALGFPYVRRLDRAQIEAKPELLEVDRKSTLEACAGFKNHPTTVLNFLEGTRFTPEKHAAQEGSFTTLLNPKVGGLAYVLTALEEELNQLIDVTIHYPHGVPSFWEFMKGDCPKVQLRVVCHNLPDAITQAENTDGKRHALRPWVESLWREKDALLVDARRNQAA